jgi:hypothetical protein
MCFQVAHFVGITRRLNPTADPSAAAMAANSSDQPQARDAIVTLALSSSSTSGDNRRQMCGVSAPNTSPESSAPQRSCYPFVSYGEHRQWTNGRSNR